MFRYSLPHVLGWTTALAAYLIAMQAADRSPGTIRLHRHYLRLLAESCPYPYAATTEDLRGVLAGHTWSPETRKSARTVFRSFYRWAHSCGHVERDPAAPLEPVRVPRAVPRPTPELVLKVALRDGDARIRLMVMLAAYAGLRAAEISRVHADDLVGDRLRIYGKGRKVRTVPIVHEQLYARLVDLDGYAFVGRDDGHLAPGTVTRLLSRALPAGWTAHTLRHRCATIAYAGTRDLLAVGAVLGHSRPETTQRYVQMPDDAMRAALSAAAA